jgi:hypothetical protein
MSNARRIARAGGYSDAGNAWDPFEPLRFVTKMRRPGVFRLS